MRKLLFLNLLFFSCLLAFASCRTDDEWDVPVPQVQDPLVAFSDTEALPIIAHRGCWSGDSLPQNSLAAFRKALDLNIYGTEFDVRQTKDGKLVINHDATYHGLSISSNTHSYLCQFTLTNGEPIPLLEDFINAYLATDTKVLMVVELKSCKVNDVVNLLERYQVLPHVLFISFSKNYCNQLVKKGYGPITYYLGGNMTPEEVMKAGYAGIDYSHATFVSHPEWIDEAKALGLKVGVWTVNKQSDIQTYLADSVIVTTDKPKIINGQAKES